MRYKILLTNDNSNTRDNDVTNSENKSDLVASILRKEVTPFARKIESISDEKGQEKNETGEIIKNANNKFLIEVLSPEIRQNEEKKRHHKDVLMVEVAIFLSVQFLVLFSIVGYTLWAIIHCHQNKIPFTDSTIQIIFTFVAGYITSVVVELIAILKYIVTNVFDTSISGLVETFKER